MIFHWPINRGVRVRLVVQGVINDHKGRVAVSFTGVLPIVILVPLSTQSASASGDEHAAASPHGLTASLVLRWGLVIDLWGLGSVM
jgi:hypothetical protein